MRQTERSQLPSLLRGWLLEVEEASFSIDGTVKEMASANMLAFYLDAGDAETVTAGDMVAFIELSAVVFHDKAAALGAKLVVYFWFDEMAGQLRMSGVAQPVAQLPFRARLDVHLDPWAIAARCLAAAQGANLGDSWAKPGLSVYVVHS